MRGNLNALVPNTEGITNYIAGSTDLAFGPLLGKKVQKFPYMLVRELVSERGLVAIFQYLCLLSLPN